MASTLRLYASKHCLAIFPKVTWNDACRGQCRLQHSSSPSRGQATAAAARTTNISVSKSASLAGEQQVPFDSLKGIIRNDTLKAITIKPFKMTHMTAVQAAVLPLLPGLIESHNPNSSVDGPLPQARDLLVKARTGTGKTLAFLVPAIEARLRSVDAAGKQAVRDAGLAADKHLEGRAKRIFARTEVGTLIITPTRELATQIANEALRLAHHHDDFEVRLFTGGTSKRLQMRDWMKGRRDIVVATPGRLLDLLHSEPEVKSGISKTQILVLDEADTLLDMGFRDDVEAIKEFLPPTPQRQTFLFSATVSREIQQIARSTLDRNHTFINTVSDTDSPVHAHVPQFHTVLPTAADQISHTIRLIAHDQLLNPGKSKVILFLATTKLTQLYATLLRELSKTSLPSLRNTHIYEIHSKRTQDSRSATSDAFRQDKTGASVLVSSDVSARGVDYPGVTRVIQLGIPSGTEHYIHRIGRTGRAGTSGRGDLVLLPWEVGFLSWQLAGIPLKPVTTNELKSQLNTLGEEYDADPMAAFKDVPHVRPNGGFSRLDRNKPKVYSSGQKKILENIPAAVDSLLPSLDEEAIKETFASMLGYYMSKAPELRVQKDVIVKGCKDWTTQACGLPVPPYVSESFLQRLGFSGGRTRRFGQSASDNRFSLPPKSNTTPWGARGQQNFKGRTQNVPDWARSPQDLGPNDTMNSLEEDRTTRYDSSRRRDGPPHSSMQSVLDDHELPRRRQNDSGWMGERFGGNKRMGDYGNGGGSSFTGRRPRQEVGGFGMRQ